jgi:hypothetical protein
MSDQEKEWVDGLRVEQPHENAPVFVKMKGSIKCSDMLEFCKKNIEAGKEWVNFDVKTSQKGTWYAEVDNWKPEGQPQEQKTVNATDLKQYNQDNPDQGGESDINVEDIPF